MNILLVDDSPVNLQLLGKFIEKKKGIHSVMVQSGNQAKKGIEMAAMMGIKFDLIISDFYMDDGSGLDLYYYLRDKFPSTPFFLLTSAKGKDLFNCVKGEKVEEILRGIGKSLVSKPMNAKKLEGIFSSLK